MKKLVIPVIALFALVFSCQAAFAADSNHVIQSWHTEAVYNENNTIDVEETITVDYLKASHGFYRAIPYIVKIEKELDKSSVGFMDSLKLKDPQDAENDTAKALSEGKALADYSYRFKINNIRVEGETYETDTSDGVKVIKIGSENRTVTGLVDYTISYTIDVGDDRVAGYDEIFFTVLGADNAATVNGFTFNVTFPKPLPASANTALYTGSYGSTSDSGINYTISDTAIYGEAMRPFDTGEAITIYSRLPEGYFTGERTASPFALYAMLGGGALMLIIILIVRMRQIREAPVVTVEFTAPDGISSAEVGYIFNNVADDKDILSLVIWLASKGHLTISGEEHNTVLHKANPLPKDAPHYMHTFYNGLFKKGDELELSKATSKVYEKIQTAKGELTNEFTGKRLLYSTKSVVFSFLLALAAAALALAGLSFAHDFIYSSATVCAFICAATLLLSGFVGVTSTFTWSFASMGARTWSIISRLVPLAIGVGLSVIVSFYSVTGFTFAPTVLYLICGAISLLAPSLTYPTAYNTEITGKLLGLRNFIQMAELERLELLVHDNPQYYYDILPYAYVFNLTDVWAKQFETLNIPQPDWYSGTMHMSYFNMYWLTRSLNHSQQHMVQDMAAQASKSGGGGGTSFGGGGGFSGGGVGGGGSGSW